MERPRCLRRGVLGIGTLSFAGYAIVIWATPLVLVASAVWFSRKDTIPADEDPDVRYGPEPTSHPERRTSI